MVKRTLIFRGSIDSPDENSDTSGTDSLAKKVNDLYDRTPAAAIDHLEFTTHSKGNGHALILARITTTTTTTTTSTTAAP